MKNLKVLVYLTGLIVMPARGMESAVTLLKANNSNTKSSCVVEVQDQSNGDRVYKATYHFGMPKGLVRVHDYHKKKTHAEPIQLIMSRHAENNVIVEALLSKNDSTESIEGAKTIPWDDDTIKDALQRSIRADNRLLLELLIPGNYHITVPDDADVEAELSHKGDIICWPRSLLSVSGAHSRVQQLSAITTQLFKKAWSYYRNEKRPITQMLTKKGHVIIYEN